MRNDAEHPTALHSAFRIPHSEFPIASAPRRVPFAAARDMPPAPSCPASGRAIEFVASRRGRSRCRPRRRTRPPASEGPSRSPTIARRPRAGRRTAIASASGDPSRRLESERADTDDTAARSRRSTAATPPGSGPATPDGPGCTAAATSGRPQIAEWVGLPRGPPPPRRTTRASPREARRPARHRPPPSRSGHGRPPADRYSDARRARAALQWPESARPTRADQPVGERPCHGSLLG